MSYQLEKASGWCLSYSFVYKLAGSWKMQEPPFTCSSMVSNNSYKISLILLHTLATCWVTFQFSILLATWNAYSMCIHLVMLIGLLPYKTLPYPWPDSWWSHVLKFIPDMHCGFKFNTNPSTSSYGTWFRARINALDMNAEHAVSCHCDEFKYSVD